MRSDGERDNGLVDSGEIARGVWPPLPLKKLSKNPLGREERNEKVEKRREKKETRRLRRGERRKRKRGRRLWSKSLLRRNHINSKFIYLLLELCAVNN